MGIVTLKNGTEVNFSKQISRSELNKMYPDMGYNQNYTYFIEQKAGMSAKRLVSVSDEDISVIKYNFE